MKKWKRFASIAMAFAVCASPLSGTTVTAVGETASEIENPAMDTAETIEAAAADDEADGADDNTENGDTGDSDATDSDTSGSDAADGSTGDSDAADSSTIDSDATDGDTSGSDAADNSTENGDDNDSDAADNDTENSDDSDSDAADNDTENSGNNYEPVTEVSAKYNPTAGTISFRYMAAEEVVIGENAKVLLYNGTTEVAPQIKQISPENTETTGTTNDSGNTETNGTTSDSDNTETTGTTSDSSNAETTGTTNDSGNTEAVESPKIIHEYELSGLADGATYTVQLWIKNELFSHDGSETTDGSGNADDSETTDTSETTDGSGNADDSETTDTSDAENYICIFTGDIEIPFQAVTGLTAVYQESDRAIYLSYDKGNAGKAIILANGEEVGESRENQYKFEIPEEGDGQKYIFHVIACADDEACSYESAPAVTDIIEVPAWRAICDDLDIDFEPATKTVTLEWDANENVEYVYIELNDVMLAAHCTGEQFSFQYALQPGASYTFVLTPYNKLGEEGKEYSCVYDNDALETPEISDIKNTYANIVSNGNYNAFARPAVVVTWDAQPYATYSIYRAKKNSRTSYSWIGRITAEKEGSLSYTDKTVGIGKYYYKICQEIRTDTYISQGVVTTLSDAEKTTVSLPKPTVKAQLTDDGTIMLALDSAKEYVSGYRIFRKVGNGSYKKIADTSDTVYYDADIETGKTYYYKAKAYYYDASAKTKTFGAASSVAKSKSTLSEVTLTATALSSRKVKLSWNSVANAQNYEIYYKTAASGDSYRLLEETKKTGLTASFDTGTSYQFMIRACYTDTKGKTSYSVDEAEVTLGFGTPQNFRLSKTSYKYSTGSGVMRQYDKLKWNRVYGASGYKLELYHPDTQKYEVIKTIRGSSKTSCTVTHTVSTTAQTFTYRISAYKKSSIRRGEDLQITVRLGAPTGISVRKTGASSAKVTWKKVSGADSYLIYRSNGRTMVQVGTSTKNSFSDHGVALGTPYFYYVKSVYGSLSTTSEASEPFAYTSSVAKISSLKAKNTKAGTVTLSWKASSDAGSYVIYCKAGADGTYKKIGTTKSGKRTFRASGLDKDVTYYFKVGAVKMTAGGYDSASTDRTVKIQLTK